MAKISSTSWCLSLSRACAGVRIACLGRKEGSIGLSREKLLVAMEERLSYSHERGCVVRLGDY